MIQDSDLLDYYTPLEATYQKVLDDVRWQLDTWLTSNDLEDIERIYNSSLVSQRVKSFDSVLRKSRREGLESVDQVPQAIEDLLGIRVATPNKKQARDLFRHLQRNGDSWFCTSCEAPKFVPYTIEDKNNYSLRTGYQAFHVTFIHERSYEPVTTMSQWPVEIQIMSQLWNFWADYSRQYFYTGSGTIESELLPYNAPISKILDSADDLMILTADLVNAEGGTEEEQIAPKLQAGPIPDVDGVRLWLEENCQARFGSHVKVPNELFISKIADELTLYNINLTELDELLDRDDVRESYEAILEASNLTFLPPYQQILCSILLGLGWPVDRVIARVNEALWPQGVRLRMPHPGYRITSSISNGSAIEEGV